jgi:hypothetical protein
MRYAFGEDDLSTNDNTDSIHRRQQIEKEQPSNNTTTAEMLVLVIAMAWER